MNKILLALILLSSNLSWAQNSPKPLFQTDDVLEVIIRMNVKEVTEDRVDRVEHEAELFLGDLNSQKLDVNLTVRGNTRAQKSLCDFPPLTVNFKKKQVAGTIFEGQNKLKLVTHCKIGNANQQYILREYYVYKLYQLFTPYSFRVRLCKISYEDTNGKFEAGPLFGFLIEDIDDVAERNGMSEYEGVLSNQDSCDRELLDRLTLFEFLIGNLDWSVPNRHNCKLIAGDTLPNPVAVPYDFDFSGIVNTYYAQPPPEIDISSVQDRVFRGLCRTEGVYEEALNYFRDTKPQIYQLYTSSPYLGEKSITSTVKYLDSFYKIIDNPKQVDAKINKACRAQHKHLYSN